MRKSIFLAATLISMTVGATAQAEVVLDTSLKPQPGTVYSNTSNGTTLTGAPAETGTPKQGLNSWQAADLTGGATVGITKDFAQSGNGSVYFNAPTGAKADLTDYIAPYPSSTVSLSTFQGLSYDYYRSSDSTASSRYAPVIRLDLLVNGAFGGSLVLEDYYQHSQDANINMWTNVSASLTNGLFYSTNAALGGPTNAQANGGLKTVQGWLDQNAGKNIDVYGVELGVGSGWDGTFKGAVDNVAFSFNGGPTEDANFEVADDAVSAAPEPGTWALMMLGVGAIGAMLGYRKRVIVDHKAKLAVIG